MAEQRWLGTAPAVAQVNTITVGGTPANGQVYTVTMGLNNNKSVAYTAGVSDTNNSIAAALVALLKASTWAEFLEVSWANPGAPSAVITGTALTPGVTFTNASSATGTGTLATSTTTANSGPSDVSIASNWSGNATPVTGDDVWIDDPTAPDLLYNLGALSGQTFASLNVSALFQGNIGLPETNGNGYEEYRQRYFQCGATLCLIGYGLSGSGPTSAYFDFGAVQTSVVVNQTGTSQVQNLETCQLKGTHVSNVLTVNRGAVAWGGLGSDASQKLATLNVNYISSQASDASVRTGPGVTVTTANVNGGQTVLWNGPTTLTQFGGVVEVQAGNMTTADVESGTFLYLGTGTLTTLTVGPNGLADFRADSRSRTITNPVQMYSGAQFEDPFGSTGNAAFVLNKCRPADVTLDVVPGKTVTLS